MLGTINFDDFTFQLCFSILRHLPPVAWHVVQSAVRTRPVSTTVNLCCWLVRGSVLVRNPLRDLQAPRIHATQLLTAKPVRAGVEREAWNLGFLVHRRLVVIRNFRRQVRAVDDPQVVYGRWSQRSRQRLGSVPRFAPQGVLLVVAIHKSVLPRYKGSDGLLDILRLPKIPVHLCAHIWLEIANELLLPLGVDTHHNIGEVLLLYWQQQWCATTHAREGASLR
mmetsp:Transcript_8888/g.24944  ORF Transcript_8888/g.24944 Transcript_8888/m.24944 type:complete len:223 (-) Transcript_8888:1084-1752(-)